MLTPFNPIKLKISRSPLGHSKLHYVLLSLLKILYRFLFSVFKLFSFPYSPFILGNQLLEFVLFMPLSTSTPLHLRGKYCTFYSTTFI